LSPETGQVANRSGWGGVALAELVPSARAAVAVEIKMIPDKIPVIKVALFMKIQLTRNPLAVNVSPFRANPFDPQTSASG
jgi:hypothetical protein